ncbi:MAG: hypothetical protein RR863_02465 [Erysipelotrichaceae bacterium]
MSKNKVAFIVEGSRTEPQIVENLRKCIFVNLDIEVITLSYSFNIYQLWLALNEYNFNADLIDIINEKNKNNKAYLKKFGTLKSEKFSEVYLFFDYDGHQRNLPLGINGDEVIKEMLKTFNNETELGKLIVSYPMVEAIRDYSEERGICFRCISEAHINCRYKEQTSDFVKFQNINNLDENDWNELLIIFLRRCTCLLGLANWSDYVNKEITPEIIFDHQFKNFIEPYKKVLVLSAFAEFLVEFYGRYLFNENNEFVFLGILKKLNHNI